MLHMHGWSVILRSCLRLFNVISAAAKPRNT